MNDFDEQELRELKRLFPSFSKKRLEQLHADIIKIVDCVWEEYMRRKSRKKARKTR